MRDLKLMKENTIGQKMGLNWLIEFGYLTIPERNIVTFLIANRIGSFREAMSNKTLASKLGVPINKIAATTKLLISKNFLYVHLIKEKGFKPVKHHYIPTTMLVTMSKPHESRISSALDTTSKNNNPQLEPTIHQKTLKKVNPDKILGYLGDIEPCKTTVKEMVYGQ